MNIHIKVIDHKKQRYPTVGDWYYDGNGDLQIHVSKMKDCRHELLVAVHELVECLICDANNIDQTDVDKFDMEYEHNRKPGNDSEPGDDIRAPYYHEHQVASGVERILAAELDVNWDEYTKEVNGL